MTGALTLVLAGFPNPIGWAVDKAKGFVGDAAAGGFAMVIGGLTAWMLDAVVWVVGGVFGFFRTATDPDVQADWFVAGDGPYATTATIGATLMVGFVLIGIAQGVLAGDVGGMLRRMALDLPMAVLAMVGLVSVTQALVRLTDQLSGGLLDHVGGDGERFVSTVASLSALSGGTATAFVVFILALVATLAGIVLVAELVIRAALIYIVVALAPLVFAAQLWPAVRGAGRKLLELLVALIVSKLVVAVALAVAAAATVGSASGGEVTALPAPEVVAANPAGSVAQAVGILLAATAAFGVAAFSPLLVARLLPVTEAAVVASGVRGGPLRAGQQAMSMGYYANRAGGSRLTSLASSSQGTGSGGGGGATSPGRSAAATAGSAAATGAAGAAAAASRATSGTTRAGASTAPVAVDAASPAPTFRNKDSGIASRRSPASAPRPIPPPPSTTSPRPATKPMPGSDDAATR